MDNSSNQEIQPHWDLIIRSKSSWFDLDIKGLWKYRDLIVLFVRRDFVANYKQTILGPLWHLIQPILTTAMFLLVFGKIAKLPTDGINPKLFYLCGITFWNYFSGCLTATSNTFGSNAGIFGKVYFPRLVSPIATIISNLIKLGIQFVLLISGILWFAIVKGEPFYFSWTWLWIIPIVCIMALLSLGLGIIISSLTTKYRDFVVLTGFAVQLLMYATPIVYPLSYINNLKWLITINPLTYLMEAFRYAIFQHGDLSINLIYSICFTFISLFIGVLMFNKVERSFMDTV